MTFNIRRFQLMGFQVEFKSYTDLEMLGNDRSCIVVMDFAHILETRLSTLLFYGPTCIKRAVAATAGSSPNANDAGNVGPPSSFGMFAKHIIG